MSNTRRSRVCWYLAHSDCTSQAIWKRWKWICQTPLNFTKEYWFWGTYGHVSTYILARTIHHILMTVQRQRFLQDELVLQNMKKQVYMPVWKNIGKHMVKKWNKWQKWRQTKAPSFLKNPKQTQPQKQPPKNSKTQTNPQYPEQTCILVIRQKIAGFTKKKFQRKKWLFCYHQESYLSRPAKQNHDVTAAYVSTSWTRLVQQQQQEDTGAWPSMQS